VVEVEEASEVREDGEEGMWSDAIGEERLDTVGKEGREDAMGVGRGGEGRGVGGSILEDSKAVCHWEVRVSEVI
jgi:hypothetical protein